MKKPESCKANEVSFRNSHVTSANQLQILSQGSIPEEDIQDTVDFKQPEPTFKEH